MPTTIKPIFLLADSQLLFWRNEEGARFLDRAKTLIDDDELGRPARGAYLGASNGDAPEYFDLFAAAMAEIGIQDCRHIPAEPSAEDLAFLAGADLILLAGGDVWLGWTAFEKTGVKDKLTERYYGGAVLIGISAGAIQLGLKGWGDEDGVFDCLRLVPFVVDAHDEPSWSGLVHALPKAGEHARGFGIPSGGGALYHPDYSVEPVRHPLTELELTESGTRQSLVFPGSTTEAMPEDAGEGPRTMSQEELLERVLGDAGLPDPEDSVN